MRDTNQICFTIGLLRDTFSPSTKEFHGLGYEAHMLSSAKDERIKFNSANQLQERAHEYGRRLKSSAHQLAMKYETKKSEGLLDVPKSSSSEEAALMKENSKLKETIKRMRTIMEKQEGGVKERVCKVQEARAMVEVAIKEWGEGEEGLVTFLQKF